MIRTLIKLTGFLMILILVSCQADTSDKLEFEKFQNEIRHFKNHYNLGDTLTSLDNFWDNTDYIDTSFLLKYRLIDTSIETESYNKLKTLKDYHCSLIGQYKKDNTSLILSYSIQIGAGDGNPIFTATPISDSGRLLDFFRTDLVGIHDPFYQPITYISISNNFEISVTQTAKKFKEDQDKLVLVDSTSATTKYTIDRNGAFKSLLTN